MIFNLDLIEKLKIKYIISKFISIIYIIYKINKN